MEKYKIMGFSFDWAVYRDLKKRQEKAGYSRFAPYCKMLMAEGLRSLHPEELTQPRKRRSDRKVK